MTTRLSKTTILEAITVLAALRTTSGFHGPFVPGRAGAIRLKHEAGRTPLTSSSTQQGLQAKIRTSTALGLFEEGSRGHETTLPQDEDAYTKTRKDEPKETREPYEWRLKGEPIDVPYLKDLPAAEKPGICDEWTWKAICTALRIAVGVFRGPLDIREVFETLKDVLKKSQDFAAAKEEEKPLLLATGVDEQIAKTKKPNQRPVDLKDYMNLSAFPIKTPVSKYDFDEDDAFARQRLQGVNCVTIEKCSAATRKKLKILDQSDYSGLKAKVDSLMGHGKLFVVDHELLQGMKDSRLEKGDSNAPRYLAKGIALFEATDDKLLPIRPIGIQLTQGGTATPIFTPADGYNWKIAKACFEAADFIIHEVVSHLGNTHVVMEAPMVSMNRNLTKSHPIHALLAPHVEGTAFINHNAHEVLMQKGSGVDQLTANKIEDSWELVKNQTLKRISHDFSPVADFNARGMTNDSFPGKYPYRDYGLKYWKAIHTWVKEYLDLYYTAEENFDEDSELASFLEELEEKGGHKWLGEMRPMTDWTEKKALLTKYLASLIYTASVLHAAVNFPQQPRTSFAPNTPGSVYAPIPRDKETRGFNDYLAYLPPLEIANVQVVLTNLLGSVFHTKLGDYAPGHFSDGRVHEPLKKFQQAIRNVKKELVDENKNITSKWKGRGKDYKTAANFAYTTLLPDNIPQSVNI